MEIEVIKNIALVILAVISFLNEIGKRTHDQRVKILEAKLEQMRTILGVIESDQ